MTGRLVVVGLGPGDPDLLTIKAARIVATAPVVAYHHAPGRSSNARRIVAHLLGGETVEEALEYPVTTGDTDHPGGYAGAMADFYEDCADRLADHLDAGSDVALLAEGDPLFYGSSMYVHDRLSLRYPTEIVPGVPAFAAGTATTRTPLVRQSDVLTVLPGTLPRAELARRLADTDGAIIMKLGRTFPDVVAALREAGRLDGAIYVERASMGSERHLPVADVNPDEVPYFSLIIVPGDTHPHRRRYDETRSAAEPTAAAATVHVLGLGPGPEHWLTPEAAAVLDSVDHVVGYAPYVNRVPQREGLERHASGNTVEVERARFALDLAKAGHRVAVVSGGDAGIFGMASAVFEAAADPAYADVHVEVVPGLSAVQAVAARAGAPIGADFAVLSLSDRLKSWDVVEARLRATAGADLVLAVYNPRSSARPDQVARMREVLLDHRDPATVVVIGRDVGRAEESLTVTTLGDFDPESIDMKCLVLVGASSTRVTPAGRVWTPRFVE